MARQTDESSSLLPSVAPDSLLAMQNEDHPKGRMRLIRDWISKPSIKAFVALTIIAIISFTPALLTNSHDLRVTEKGVSPVAISSSDGDGVLMFGSVAYFDWLKADSVPISWAVFRTGNYSDAAESDVLSRALDVYINNGTDPAFSYDPLGLNNQLVFSTSLSLDFGSPEYYAPNDWYYFSVVALIIEKATNRSIPITRFELSDSGAGDISVESATDLVALRYNFTYVGAGGSKTVEVGSYEMDWIIKRSQRGKGLTYSMFAINWILTLCSMVTTSITFGQQGNIRDGVALLPITVILAVPQIRSLYPGSLPFGIFLDVVGFFPQMLIIAICTVVVLWLYSNQPAPGEGPTGRGIDGQRLSEKPS